jgi:asparagine synthase (glutamine-hydrolysing)
MAGFAVILDNEGKDEIKTMLDRINHRGGHAEGVSDKGKLIMAQNYLRADNADNDSAVPFSEGGLSVCYDGQMGNWHELASQHSVGDGPFREERLLLEMYRKEGAGLLDHLGDTIFTFVISDGEQLLAARDLLGIKTLFYGRKGDTLYLASELKSVAAVTDEVYEFPAGHYMDRSGDFHRFASLPESAPEVHSKKVDEMLDDIRNIIQRSFKSRVDFSVPTGSLLSGGIDSSVIAAIASKEYREKFDKPLKTFALGVGESGDIKSAREVASHIGSDHHELIIGLDDMLEVLPRVIYYLENFDPSLVRSSLSNYLISRYAKEHGIEVLLSGEGGDEVFCGYRYLKSVPHEDLFGEQMKCIGFLHSNASLRLDRMNECNSMKVVTPLISGELLDYSLSIPPEYKMKPQSDDRIEKWIFRKAYENMLPSSIVWRIKQEFSQGSGSADVLPQHFENEISDSEFEEWKERHPVIRSKEELCYFRIFTEHFGSSLAVETVGQWVSL